MSKKPHIYEMPQPGQVWQHFRGRRYIVNHVGIDTETGSPQVAYYPEDQEPEYRRSGPSAVEWAQRRLDIFLGSTKDEDGGNVWRFTHVVEEK